MALRASLQFISETPVGISGRNRSESVPGLRRNTHYIAVTLKPARKSLLKTIDTLDELKHIKKIEGYDCYYRLRIGDYRLGLKVMGDTVELIRFLHRRDIYRRFP